MKAFAFSSSIPLKIGEKLLPSIVSLHTWGQEFTVLFTKIQINIFTVNWYLTN